MFVPLRTNSLQKLTFTWLPSDDKKSAIVEFISADKATLAPIRAAANAPWRETLRPKNSQ